MQLNKMIKRFILAQLNMMIFFFIKIKKEEKSIQQEHRKLKIKKLNLHLKTLIHLIIGQFHFCGKNEIEIQRNIYFNKNMQLTNLENLT